MGDTGGASNADSGTETEAETNGSRDDWRTAYLSDDQRPKTWGRRLYAHKRARVILNEASAQLLRDDPDYVDDPADPTVDEVLDYIRRDYGPNNTAMPLITDLLSKGLTYQEAVVWYLWAHADWDLNDLYYATSAPVSRGERIETGGHAADRRNAQRTLQSVLQSAAGKLGVDAPDPDALDFEDDADDGDQEDTET